jgi:transposase
LRDDVAKLNSSLSEFIRTHSAAMARGDEMSHRLMTIPGLGPMTASAMAASVQNISAFSGPREFAAFLGLTPR